MNDSDELDSREEDSIASITPDVMTVLSDRGFFAALDDLFCPIQEGSEAAKCKGNFETSKAILRKMEFPEEAIEDVVAVLHTQGACCDCEVLYNAVEESRFKAKYWKAQVKDSGRDPGGE
jgi:hypothetical protein